MPRRRRKLADIKQEEKRLKTKTIRPKEEQAVVILFADVIGCSEISNHKKLKEYNVFINNFQRCFKSVCEHYKKEEYNNNDDYYDYQSRGDEGCLKIFVPNRDDLSIDVDNAICIGLDLKRQWLLEEDNAGRIANGLLPVDIAIGIHSGTVWVNKEEKKGKIKYRPEGYAINLAKRIESASRKGKFSHILVSESAREELHLLKDECHYRFSKPFTIDPKGISRSIKVFEVMHHFLPTDWTDDINKPSEVSMRYGKLTEVDVETARTAYLSNPMNLWLAEEYIILEIMYAYHKLKNNNKENDPDEIKKEYGQALEIARRVANSNLRDAGVLALLGFILGEQWNFEEEQQMYDEGMKLDKQDGLLHWYMAYSILCELDDVYESKGMKLKDLFKSSSKKIEIMLAKFKRACDLMPMNAWIVFDYACAQSWWSKVDRKRFRDESIGLLKRAIGLNPKAIEKAKKEPYLEPIISDPEIKIYLKERQ